ncbi:MAG: tRNA pseudouridine(55) synthase TruB [Acidobacteriota bacterium]
MLTESSSLSGILVLDKPAAWTSHDAVNRVRRLAGTRKVGHLGTLDPLATGVLPLVIGRATRLAQFFSSDRKSYRASIQFGVPTSTYDSEGEPLAPPLPIDLTTHDIPALLARFTGPQSQLPPPISAKKINGVPAYKLARQNQPVELKPVDIEIFRISLLHLTPTTLELDIDSTAGTYIRSLAHDLGQALGCGAHVSALRRTRSGDFDLSHAHTFPELEAHPDQFPSFLLSGAQLLPHIPAYTVDALTESQIRHGRDFRTSPFRSTPTAQRLKVLNQHGHLIAIADQTLPLLYHPSVVL